ncbi:MAG: hypothetical protein JWN38_623 [Candidatus Saccharibacteria bacterium]|nr:hypothetical protein [Candidatus Saccharibacteria bacterium]
MTNPEVPQPSHGELVLQEWEARLGPLYDSMAAAATTDFSSEHTALESVKNELANRSELAAGRLAEEKQTAAQEARNFQIAADFVHFWLPRANPRGYGNHFETATQYEARRLQANTLWSLERKRPYYVIGREIVDADWQKVLLVPATSTNFDPRVHKYAEDMLRVSFRRKQLDLIETLNKHHILNPLTKEMTEQLYDETPGVEAITIASGSPGSVAFDIGGTSDRALKKAIKSGDSPLTNRLIQRNPAVPLEDIRGRLSQTDMLTYDVAGRLAELAVTFGKAAKLDMLYKQPQSSRQKVYEAPTGRPLEPLRSLKDSLIRRWA